jgi:hypothetical protein
VTKINIEGGDTEQQRLVEHFTRYAVEMLCGQRIAAQIEVSIELVENLYKAEGYLGYCTWTDEPYRSREFEVEVDANLHPRFLLTTLAHEIVHIKQYAKGELRCLIHTPNKRSWYGKRHETRNITPRESTRLPWEVEARGLEEQIFVEWCEDCKVTDNWARLDLHVD